MPTGVELLRQHQTASDPPFQQYKFKKSVASAKGTGIVVGKAVARFSGDHLTMRDRSLIWYVVKAFQELGGRAHLKAVYREVRRFRYEGGGEDLNKLIRARIYEHSSDSPKWTRNPADDLFRCTEWRSGVWELRKDRARELAPLNVEDQDLTDQEIDQALLMGRLKFGLVPTDSPKALARQRRGQGRIRTLTLANYGGQCAVCDVSDPALLVASHIVGWAEAPEHRGDLSNVICLCRMHDALFEAGYWSLGERLELLKRRAVRSQTIRQLLAIMPRFQVPLENPPAPCFTQHHRERAGLTSKRRSPLS
jgi:HNH endonuclease